MIRIANGVEVVRTPEEFAAWEAERATYVPPTPDPLRNLEPDQFHTMLNLSGYLPDIEAVLAASDDMVFVAAARAKLQFAKHFVRDDPLVVGLAQSIGLTPEMLDSMWDQAHSF